MKGVLLLVILWAALASGLVVYFYLKLRQANVVRYFETNDWFDGKKGVRYAQSDENMDSLVYLPNKKQVCWFHGRRLSEVDANGSFTIKFANGGRLSGTVRPNSTKIELIGVAGTLEEGVIESLVLNQ
jgi:hypothetical protein